MSLDPRTPVLVGYGQVNQHTDPSDAVEPVALMAQAARAAADPRVLAAVDAIRVVNLLSWRYRDPGLALGGLIGADAPATRYTGIGGNVPQTLVNQACLDIMAGRNEVVLLAGAETWRTRKAQKANGIRPDWTSQDESVPVPPGAEDAVDMSSPAQDRVKLALPSHVYPLFEEALRVAAGETPDEHRRRIAELWARFNDVAQHNPHAWSNQAYTAAEIGEAGPRNRMISWPYTKLMNSNNMVDQGAALILTSVGKAEQLQIPRDRWVFPYAGTDAHDTYLIGERASFSGSPAIRIAGRRVLELTGLGIDDIDAVDVYSCFPSAVQVAARELGLALDDPARPLTVTGGLPFFGGAGNNYSTHAIAEAAITATTIAMIAVNSISSQPISNMAGCGRSGGYLGWFGFAASITVSPLSVASLAGGGGIWEAGGWGLVSSAMPSLKLLMPLATSPMRPEIRPPPNSSSAPAATTRGPTMGMRYSKLVTPCVSPPGKINW